MTEEILCNFFGQPEICWAVKINANNRRKDGVMG